MRAKVTWRTGRWSAAGWVAPVAPEFRQRFGDPAADTVELVADMLRSHRTDPTTQDVKATLRALADAPAVADLTRLDPFTAALLLKHALRTYRAQSIKALPLDQVAECARAALADLPAINGRPKTDALALLLVRDLLALLPPGTTPTARDELLLAAFMQCGFGATPENLRRLLAKVGQVF